MSRRKDLFENADLEKVAELVQLAKGTRTQLQFHIDSGISVSYLNQIINKQIKTPPSPKMLQSIANCSNGVSISTQNTVNTWPLHLSLPHFVAIIKLNGAMYVLEIMLKMVHMILELR